MAIGNFQQRLSDDDRDSLNLRNNPPEYDPEFGGDSMDESDWGDLFSDNDDDSSMGMGGDPFGSPMGNDPFGSPMGNDPFGSPMNMGGDPFGSPMNMGGDPFGSPMNNNPFGNPFTGNNQPAEQKPDNMDKLIDGSIVVAKQAWSVIKQAVAQIKQRNYDDLGYFSRNMILTGLGVALVSVLFIIVGTVGNIAVLKQKVQATWLISGMLTCGVGLVSMGQAAIALQKLVDNNIGIDDIPDISEIDQDDNTFDYEENLGDELEDLFGQGDDSDDGLDDMFGGGEDDEDSFDMNNYNWGNEEQDEQEDEFNSQNNISNDIDLDSALENVPQNQILNRKTLLDTMIPFFPKNRPDFQDLRQIEPDSNEFNDLELITVKSIANVMQKEIEEVQTKLIEAEQGMFSYKLKFKRINQLNTDGKREALAEEFVNYMRQSPNDKSVQATVQLDGDYFVVTVSKGEQAVVTIGDVMQKRENRKEFENTDNKLPVIVGIDDLGNVIIDDAKKFDTCMIMGKPRQGKSWYVFNMLINMMAFNSPEDVQFIVVDPKQANLFNKLQLMPHVIGLHSDKHVLEIMDDIIENEGERRKKLLKNNECDDIWGLRRKGIQLPILYLVIDEVITVMGNLRAKDPKKEKEFNQKLKILIQELPFVGIRLIFIPHRATGLVDKTNRQMLQFIAAVRSAREEIEEGLGTKWYRGLTKPGDMAIKTQSREDAFYARGPAIATQDEDTASIIVALAKAYYKLGVQPSDLKSTLTIQFNRNENTVRERLNANGVIQYDANKINEDDFDMYSELNSPEQYSQGYKENSISDTRNTDNKPSIADKWESLYDDEQEVLDIDAEVPDIYDDDLDISIF